MVAATTAMGMRKRIKICMLSEFQPYHPEDCGPRFGSDVEEILPVRPALRLRGGLGEEYIAGGR